MAQRCICVFAGSNPGAQPAYRKAATAMGQALAARDTGLVYGGGKVGLMGALADAVLGAGGHVIGVIPEAIAAKEVAHDGLPDLRVVQSMHERKALMADLSEGFVALPGGVGTLEELFEVFTWAQLGIHTKPVGLLNVAGYFDGLLAFLDHATAQRFIGEPERDILLVDDDPLELLDRMAAYQPIATKQWLDRDQR